MDKPQIGVCWLVDITQNNLSSFLQNLQYKGFFLSISRKLKFILGFWFITFKFPKLRIIIFIQFSSFTQSCPTLCDPMNQSMPGLPVHHQLLESTQTHVHWVGDAIQPSHPLLSPSPPALNISQHQGLFK